MKKRKPLCLLALFLSLCILFAGSVSAAGTYRNRLVNLNGFTVYFDKTGNIATKKFVTIKDKTYYFDKNGYMTKNKMFTVGKHTYYANTKGVIAKNKFVTIGTKRYFFNEKGYRKTGWVNYNSHTYYCPLDGTAYKERWKKIGSYYYYFTDKYYIRKNNWVGKYYCDSQGHRVSAPPSVKKTISMKTMLQRPELPTGCESVALTIVLNHYGFNLAKTTIASSFMPRSETNFVTSFMGSPFSAGGCGIYSPGLTTTANKFLTSKKSSLKAYDLTGTDFPKLKQYIDKGIPVIVWNTMYMQNPVPVYSLNTLGKTWTFYQSEHCVVYCGYDTGTNKYLINDPLEGLVWRDAPSFINLYNKLGKMAVAIY